MSIHSVKRQFWIEEDTANKGKLNRWLKSCQLINYRHVEKEIATFEFIQRNRYMQELSRRFVDWKVLSLCRIRSRYFIKQRTFRLMKLVYRLRVYFRRWLEKQSLMSLKGSFIRWRNTILYSKTQDTIREREARLKKAKYFLRRCGRAARYTVVIDHYLYEILGRRLFLRWKRAAKVFLALRNLHNEYLLLATMKNWYRIQSRLATIRKVFAIATNWLRRVFQHWKLYVPKPPMRRSVSPKSPRSPRKVQENCSPPRQAGTPSIEVETPKPADDPVEVIACTCMYVFLVYIYAYLVSDLCLLMLIFVLIIVTFVFVNTVVGI